VRPGAIAIFGLRGEDGIDVGKEARGKPWGNARSSRCSISTPSRGHARAYIDELRGEHRILYQPDLYATGGHWLLFQQADIDFVLRSTDLFTNNFGPLLEDMPDFLLPEQQKSLTFMDPPQHKQYRSLVEYAFRPAASPSANRRCGPTPRTSSTG